MTIQTDRLVLCPFAPEDEDALFAIFRDDGVRHFLLDGHLVDRDWVRGEIEGSVRRFAQGSLGIFLASEPPHPALSPSTGERVVGRPVGFAGFRPFREPPVLELLYGLYPAFWGRGFATEMSQAMIALAFERHGLDVIDTAVDAPNVASVRVLGRLGFSEVGQSLGAFGTASLSPDARRPRSRARTQRDGPTLSLRGSGKYETLGPRRRRGQGEEAHDVSARPPPRRAFSSASCWSSCSARSMRANVDSRSSSASSKSAPARAASSRTLSSMRPSVV